MSFLYDKLIRQAAIRIDAIVGSTATAKQSAYITAPLTATQVGNVDFPLASIQDAAISAVARIVRTYANIKGHPFHNFHAKTTANIAHEGNIPSVSSDSLPIVGVYGAIRDATTGDELTEQPVQLIRSIVDSLADGTLKGSYFHYKIAGRRLYHTRTNATIDVVTFDEATERTAVAGGGNTPLPDACFDIAWNAMVAILVVDDAYASQASLSENYVQNALGQLMSGAQTFLPAPNLVNTETVSVS